MIEKGVKYEIIKIPKGRYYIKTHYSNYSLPTQFGPFLTTWGAKRKIKEWTGQSDEDKVIARYDKDGKKIEPLSWTDFC